MSRFLYDVWDHFKESSQRACEVTFAAVFIDIHTGADDITEDAFHVEHGFHRSQAKE